MTGVNLETNAQIELFMDLQVDEVYEVSLPVNVLSIEPTTPRDLDNTAKPCTRQPKEYGFVFLLHNISSTESRITSKQCDSRILKNVAKNFLCKNYSKYIRNTRGYFVVLQNKHSSLTLSWKQASNHCTNIGGFLPMFRDALEMEDLMDLMKTARDFSRTNYVYLGMKFSFSEKVIPHSPCRISARWFLLLLLFLFFVLGCVL